MRNTNPFMKSVSLCAVLFLSLLTFSALGQQQFDVALTKTTITNAPVKYGTPIPFNLTIYNQGLDTITNVDVIDHFGNGYEFQMGLNMGWNPHPMIPNAVTTTYTDMIPPGEFRIVTINLIAQPGTQREDWINTAEVLDFTDRFGTSQVLADMDSGGDVDPDNDAGGLLGSPADNEITGDGSGMMNDGVAATDEDDHDRDTIQIFDLALTKVLDPITGYSYGDTLTFTTTVYNQGNIRARIVRIRDIVPEGYINPIAVNTAAGWSNSAANPIFQFDVIEPFSQVQVELKLILDPTQADGDAWVNYAEIISARFDNFAPIGLNIDADSEMASNSDGERSVGQGDPDDNNIGSTSTNPGDQDDHDPAEPEVFDLALIKERATAVASFNYGTPIDYSYTVINQGNMAATDIVLVDSLPCGAMFEQALNPDWSFDPVTRIATRTIPGPLEPLVAGLNDHIYRDTLVLTVIGCFDDQATAWTNYMEIAQATNINGVQTTEIDGVFDTNFANDPGGIPLSSSDNQTNGIGILDEDNHDVELLQVYDLALKKELITQGPYTEGQDIDFRIRVYNQGNVVIEDLVIEDFIPEGFGYDQATNTPFGWTTSYSTLVNGVPTVFPDTLNVMEDIFLASEDSVDITITLSLELEGQDISDWYNFAHVWVATDTVGNNRFDDADSNPFIITAEEFAVIPGSVEDDNIFSFGKSVMPAIEEDDHDVANVSFFDLSLTKTATSTPTMYGEAVTFDIVVKNEGVQFAHDINVIEYLPCGLTFTSSAGWTVNAMTGNPEYFYTDTLFAGDEVTIPITLNVEECTMIDADSYRNETEIGSALDESGMEGDDQDSTPGNEVLAEDDMDDALIPVFDLSLTKTIATPPANFMQGTPVTYNIVVSNDGNVPAVNTEITDFVPCGLDFSTTGNTGWSQVGSSDDVSFVIMSTIAPGTSITIPLTLTIGNCIGPNDLDNVVEITDDNDADGPVDDFDSTPDNGDPDEDDIDTAPLGFFDLALTKTLTTDVTNLVYGQDLDYQIVVSNDGSIPATSFTVTDIIPCGLTFNMGDNTGWTQDPMTGNVSFDVNTTLDPDMTTTINLVLELSECAMPDADSWNNIVEITEANDPDGPADDQDSTPDNGDPDEDDQDNAPLDIGDLALTKMHTDPVGPIGVGVDINYTVSVTNQGNVEMTNFTITDYIPCGLEFSPNNGWTENMTTGNAEFIVSALGIGETVDLPILLTVTDCNDSSDTEAYINKAEVSDQGNNPDDPDSNPDDDPNNDPPNEDDFDEDPLEWYDLSLEKTSAPLVNPTYGSVVNYTITVTNEGSLDASDVSVTDYIPCGLRFEAAQNTNWSFDPVENTVTNTNIVNIDRGESFDFILNLVLEECLGNVSGAYNNIAEITGGDDPSGNPGDDEDSTPDNGDPDEDDQDDDPLDVFDLSLTKTISVPPANFMQGTPVTYNIVVTNDGNVPAVNTEITDFVPCGLDFSTTGNTGWSQVGSSDDVSFVIMSTIAPGASVTIPLTLTIGNCTGPDDLDNVAEITDDNDANGPVDDFDSTPDNGDPDEDDIDTAELDFFDLSLTKTLTTNSASLTYGMLLNYTIEVTNEGTIPATSFTVSDEIPCGLAFSTTGNAGWTLNNQGNATFNYTSTLNPGQSVQLILTLILEECAMPTSSSWNNIAEISEANDPDGPADDEDSTPNNGDPNEDDQDNAPLDVFDLTLSKTVTSTQAEYVFGEEVVYNIQVMNQGNGVADGFQITDYIPCGMTLSGNNALNWSINSGGFAEYTTPNSLQPGAAQNFEIRLIVGTCAMETGERRNIAEITDNGNGNPTDTDSTPGNEDPDEDDQDEEVISVNSGATIGDFVWNDTDGDGIQDFNESGIPGVIVTLFTEDGDVVAVMETGPDGSYEFEEVDPGIYYVVFDVDDDFIPSPPNAGNDDNDSNVTEENGPGSTSLFMITSGQDDETIDGGFFICSLIKGVTYYDVNEDDIRQTTENGINGLVVNLFRRVNGVWTLWDSETTHHDYDTPSDDGIWDFCVAPGQYYIEVQMPPIGLVRVRPFIGGSNFDSDINGANGVNTTPTFNLSPGGSKTDLGAGYYPMATVGNRVWHDENFNGIQEDNEPKVEGVIVQVYNMDNEIVDQAVTDADGIYTVEYLRKEEYYLRFQAPEGFSFTTADAAGDDINSDVNHAMGLNTTSPRMYKPGEIVENIDAGIVNGALPLTWGYLYVDQEKETNEVYWSTKVEMNVDIFEIERRLVKDDRFIKIGTIEAVGNTINESRYSFSDSDVEFQGQYYYRIKQIDLDGKSDYSSVVLINRNLDIKYNTYPNPTSEKVNINGNFSDLDYISVKLINSNGEIVKKENFNNLTQPLSVDLDNLASGIYHIELTSKGELIHTDRVIKI